MLEPESRAATPSCSPSPLAVGSGQARGMQATGYTDALFTLAGSARATEGPAFWAYADGTGAGPAILLISPPDMFS